MFLKYCSIWILTLQISAPAQTLPSAHELLEKSIAYHDPGKVLFKEKLKIVLYETGPNNRDRETTLILDFKNNGFSGISIRDGRRLEYYVDSETAYTKLDGSTNISDADKKKYRIGPGREKFIRDYYSYLYGLPMKLKDAGTHLAPKVEESTFQGKKVYALKITYDEKVGADTWYFYFNIKTFALAGYLFYHDESKKDGEYITLEGEVKAGNIRLPKTRKWYLNQGGKFLGTDTIVSFEIL